jgi:hypothetical protein
MYRPSNRRLRQLKFAEEAFAQGARCKVVEKITGLTRTEISRVFTDEAQLHTNTGRMPSSIDWFVAKRNNLAGVHASHFYSYFWHQIDRGIDALEALIVAFRLYSKKCISSEKMDFDRAFLLVTVTHGFWIQKKPSLEAARCADCESLHIGYLGLRNTGRRNCSICKARRADKRNAKGSLSAKNDHQLALVSPIIEAVPFAAKASRSSRQDDRSALKTIPAS